MGALLLCFISTLHSTASALLRRSIFTFDTIVLFFSSMRYACATVMLYHTRAARFCLLEEVGILDRVHWYAAGVNGFLFCMMQVFLDPLRVPRGLKVIAFVLVASGMIKAWVWFFQVTLQKDKFPEYHVEETVHLWIDPLKPLSHQVSGLALVSTFYARAFFCQVIMGEDFTLLRGKFRLAF